MNEKLPSSVAQAIITLIPKNNIKKLKKPISFFSVDYKILTKIISSRLKTTLDYAISKEETFGIPNRSIFSNLFTIHELTHCNTMKKLNHALYLQIKKKLLIKLYL